jgi:hypothetical protein
MGVRWASGIGSRGVAVAVWQVNKRGLVRQATGARRLEQLRRRLSAETDPRKRQALEAQIFAFSTRRA